MKILWNSPEETSNMKTYKTVANAKKAAEKLLGKTRENHRVLIATDGERYFPVCIGEKALQDGVHFHMAVTF